MQQGARDAVTLVNPLRLRLVVSSRAGSVQPDAALEPHDQLGARVQRQLKSFMAGSADAIAHVQEGIVVDANPAWLELLRPCRMRTRSSARR